MEQADVKSQYLIEKERFWVQKRKLSGVLPKTRVGRAKSRRLVNVICELLPGRLKTAEVLPEEIAGIGIDGQSWSAIAVDKDGKVRQIRRFGWIQEHRKSVMNGMKKSEKKTYLRCVEIRCSRLIQRQEFLVSEISSGSL